MIGGQHGTPLEGAVRDEMEARMGDSFSDVQLHTGPEAAKAASALEARAFTTGNHVVFNRGEYDPESAEGKYLLAHELAHVRQQTGGAISMLPQEGSSLVIDPDPELEREADEVARKALEGEEPVVAHRLGTEVHIQRLSMDSLVPLLGMAPQMMQMLPMFAPYVKGDVEEKASEAAQVYENRDQVDWFKAIYEGGKKDLGRAINLGTELPGMKAIKEGYNNASEQLQPSFQDQLESATIPDRWLSQIKLELTNDIVNVVTSEIDSPDTGTTGETEDETGLRND
ncbi:eCIS core domain-containing protein [Natronobiforma cellulositropha]|uniref:eCIS core domain-containing protein n=1 Tax=Natronobiforma cellulositropha TaxID=1679076 RepID=UPI003CCDC404